MGLSPTDASCAILHLVGKNWGSRNWGSSLGNADCNSELSLPPKSLPHGVKAGPIHLNGRRLPAVRLLPKAATPINAIDQNAPNAGYPRYKLITAINHVSPKTQPFKRQRNCRGGDM
eukprot:3502417-Karenia_brevis.AAC.1